MMDSFAQHERFLFPHSWWILALALGIAMVISLEKRDPVRTLCWLLVLFALPVIGIVFYLLFGENLRDKKWKRHQETVQHFFQTERKENYIEQETDNVMMLSQDNTMELPDRGIMNLVMRSGMSPVTGRNSVKIYKEGREKFLHMLEDIQKAEHHVHLEYFIIRDGILAEKLRRLLIEKAEQGVEVRILYDDIGSWRLYLKPAFMHSLRAAGVEVKTYVQGRFPYLYRKLNYRNHRKICIIDGKVGYVGGINIGDEYVHGSKKFGYWRDTHLQIKGEAVQSLQTVFITDWFALTGKQLLDARYFPRQNLEAANSIVQIVTSGADSPHQTIYEAYFYVIAQAKETIYIETPYFVPDEALLMALKTAALSGVDIRIIFPAVADHFMVYHASLSYLEQIAGLGAAVYFYQKTSRPSFLHSKMVLVDHKMASIGTANLDIRSFAINSEINAFIYDRKTIEQLYQIFAEDLQNARCITTDEFKKRRPEGKIIDALCRLFSPLL